MQDGPSVAVECNSRSLKELNAYIDRLESSETVSAPFSRRIIQFFTTVINRRGKPISAAYKPVNITLESIPPSADLLEREEIAVRLVRSIEKGMEGEGLFSSKSADADRIEPIISSRSGTGVRSELNKIWQDEAIRDQIRNSIFQSVDDRMERRKNYQAILIFNKLMKKYSKIKNTKRRLQRIAGAAGEVDDLLKERLTPSIIDQIDTDESHDEKVKIIESGFHPDLVFFDPDLSNDQREEGISRICGVNLETESDHWLLENIWKAVRVDKSPSVPVVLSTKYEASLEGGFLYIPFDFILDELVDFLEENLESVRIARKSLLESFVPVYSY